MRALLHLLRENKAAVQCMPANCYVVLHDARSHLQILDPVRGDQDLINSVEVEQAKLLSCIH